MDVLIKLLEKAVLSVLIVTTAIFLLIPIVGLLV